MHAQREIGRRPGLPLVFRGLKHEPPAMHAIRQLQRIRAGLLGAVLAPAFFVAEMAVAQRPVRPSASVFALSQESGGESGHGAALSVGAWFPGSRFVHRRLELGYGNYTLVNRSACEEIPPSDCGGAFPRLVTLSGGVVVGAPSGNGPFATFAIAAVQGFGNGTRTHRRALTPDLGIGFSGGGLLLEARYRWLPTWERQPFRQFSLGIGWRPPGS